MTNPLHEIFIPEAEENILILEERVIRLEEEPENADVINEAFRAIHSIKGGAGLAGFPKMRDFTHAGEDLLEQVRNGSLKVEKDIISVLLNILDVLKIMVDNIKGGREADDDIETGEVKERILALIDKSDAHGGGKTPRAEEKKKEKEKENLFYLSLNYYPEMFKSGIDPRMFLADLKAVGTFMALSLDTSTLPDAEGFDPETLYISWKGFFRTEKSEADINEIFCFVIDESRIEIVDLTDSLKDEALVGKYRIEGKTITDHLSPGSTGIEPTKQYRRSTDLIASSFIRVQTEKLERIFNTVSELIITEANLNLLTERYEESLPEEFSSLADTFKNITRILQEQVTSLRMMSLSSTFDRFKRVVRDIAMDLGKSVHLVIEGQDTELDKNMIEKLNDPLKHIIRNSIDHGIETETERRDKGKSPEGILKLAAYIKDGKVTIEIADDGRGIDREKILEKARDKGLVKESDSLGDSEILSLIFHPGLSTAKEVTDLSGRGVGMDVVKSSIRDLNGNVDISSVKDEGTTIRLHLPLTLAILDGMLVEAGKEKYIIPTLSILEIFRPEEEHLKTVSGKGEVVYFRGDYIPMLRLSRIFGIQGTQEEPTRAELIVVSNVGIKTALMVDNVVEQFQVVLKSLEQNYRQIDNISSATILGNGDVALILDVQSLIQNFAKGSNVS